MINVTKTYLPSFEKYTHILRRAWDKAWITNHGELVLELEEKLRKYLGVRNLLFCNNGTVVLQMALKACEISGDVITTPFSYVATTNVLLWENCNPVFVDIEPQTFCINPAKIEAAITEKTQAILATHVYGYPCDIEKIQDIAQKYKLKVIYDGAHAFGSLYKGNAVLGYGDISTCSFHATKIFHTVEGGCVITENDELAKKLELYRSFGHKGDEYFSIGINGKNSEFHAAMGLCNLDDFPSIMQDRMRVSKWYDEQLKSTDIQFPLPNNFTKYNYAYYPVFFKSEIVQKKVAEALKKEQINTRRYFYPSLNKLHFIKAASCPISEDLSARVLCLPLFYGLSKNEVERICAIVIKNNQ